MQLYEKQPAYLLYPLSRGWRVMGYVKDNLFKRTGPAAAFCLGLSILIWKFANRLPLVMRPLLWLVGLPLLFAALFQYVSAFLVFVVFLVGQLTFLATWTGLSLVTMALLALFTRLYGAWYQSFYRCNNHHSMVIPVFVCPGCGAEHTRLWPSVYGIFHHHCRKCEKEELPTLEWLGRKKLLRKCPTCNDPMPSEIGPLTNVHIPVVGGPSSGKSNFIVSSTLALFDHCSATRTAIAFADSKVDAEFRANAERLTHGREMLKTTDIVPRAYNLTLKRAWDLVGKIIYFYDAAGEAYGDEQSTLLQSYYEFVTGLVFIVDPFAIEAVDQQFEGQLDGVRSVLRPSTTSVMAAYERTLTVLEASVRLRRGKRFPHPVAVVVTKCDALEFDDTLGAAAARRLLATDPSLTSESDALNLVVRKFLEDHELDQFVRDIELQFSRVRYVSCSALGRMPDPDDARHYQSSRVLEPLAWVLAQGASIDLGLGRAFRPNRRPARALIALGAGAAAIVALAAAVLLVQSAISMVASVASVSVAGVQAAAPPAQTAAPFVAATPDTPVAIRPEPEAAPAASFCSGDQPVRFVLGFADLKQAIGAPMGDPVECEHANSDGDVVQSTTSGLAVNKPQSNMATFTDGYHRWALTPDGLLSWEGNSATPPEDAALVPPADPSDLAAAVSPTPPAAAAPPVDNPLDGTWVGWLDQAGVQQPVTLVLQVDADGVAGTARYSSVDGRYYAVRQMAGTTTPGGIEIRPVAVVDETPPPPGVSNWCPPNSSVLRLNLSQRILSGTLTGCGAGTLHLEPSTAPAQSL